MNRSLTRYRDCQYVMDRALEKPGLRYKLPTSGATVRFKQRCNEFRKILRETEEEVGPGKMLPVGETAYDVLVIRQLDAETGQPSRRGTILQFDHSESPAGTLIDPESGEETPLGDIEW